MPTKLEKQSSALRAMLPRCGFTEDNYGHFQKDTQARTLSGNVVNAKLRIKMQDVSVRIETKDDKPGSEWRKVDGAYLKDIIFTDDGVTIGKRKYSVL